MHAYHTRDFDSISHLYPNLSFKFCTSSYEWIVDSVSFNTPFCTLVHSNRKLSAKCSVCDHRGMEIAMSSLRPLCYKCHMGITEFVFPVVKNDQSLGVFFAGQFLTEAPLAVGYQALKSTCN
ncbi:MAG: PocR ligand-binding domain-containing protein, partial [[Clostridium] leptum]